MSVIGILLAAGHSRRFGSQNKLIQPLSDGGLLALSSASGLLEVLPNSLAVVRSDAIELTAKLANLGMNTIACEDNEQLMADSLVAGIRFASSFYPQSHGYIVALADMPFVQAATIRQIDMRLLQGAGIVVPRHQGQRGNPVGFSTKFT
ncbi:MAG: NTP transferase domain-containing protein, partial [Methylophilaceae bacterium]|nr:NTP transferase domain-containing protein [Methylophilaceae bacterium]